MSKATTTNGNNDKKKGKTTGKPVPVAAAKSVSKYPIQWALDCIKRYKIDRAKFTLAKCSIGNGMSSIGKSRCALIHLVIADATANKEALTDAIINNRVCALQLTMYKGLKLVMNKENPEVEEFLTDDDVTTQASTNSHMNTLKNGRRANDIVRVTADNHFIAVSQKEFMRDLKSSCV